MDLVDEIDKRAKVFVEDNQYGIMVDPSPQHLLQIIIAAMTIGASIVAERGETGSDQVTGEIPDEVFSSEQELADEDKWRQEEHKKNILEGIRRRAGGTPQRF